ncbi:DUF6483 family protein [Enterococcus sp. LJL99]
MADYEKDFILRQTKAMTEGLAKFLGKEKADEVMKQDEKEDKHKKELDKQIASELEKFKNEAETTRDEFPESKN